MREGYSEDYGTLSKIKKQVLVERHLVSREHAARSDRAARWSWIASRASSIMISEEGPLPHAGHPAGPQPARSLAAINRVDAALEDQLPYAFDAQVWAT